MRDKRKGNKMPKKDINLITLLANTRTGQLSDILKKYGNQEATSYDDLEMKVAEMYRTSPDKLAIENELANIHPHRSFILKHLAPKQEPTEQSANEGIATFVKEKDGYSNCGGNTDCGCNQSHSNACGCSHFDGPSSTNPYWKNKERTPSDFKFGSNPTDWIGPIALVGVIGIIAFAMISASKHTKFN